MLIKCPECELQISDKALFCPHCGYPLQPGKISAAKRRKKLPNGFGQITKISNPNLKKPYRAMITVGHNKYGRPISKILKPVGYFETYNEAYTALINNAKYPFGDKDLITLEDVYKEWSDSFYSQISKSMQLQYELAWKYCLEYKSMKFIDIKPRLIKEILSKTDTPKSIGNLIKFLFNKLFDYAIENEIVDKNYSRIIKPAKKENTVTHHISFTDEEISTLWKHRNELPVQWILVQCYTGLRPDELCNIELANINIADGYLIAGSKTKAGKNRTVPIHESIMPIVMDLYDKALSSNHKYLLLNYKTDCKIAYKTYTRAFHQVCKEYHLEGHRPHDPRKFFVTTAKKYNMDEYAIKLIVGHAITDITENVYTERSVDWLKQEMSKIQVNV